MPDLDATRTFWDKEVDRPTHTSWLEHPTISLYALRQIDPVNAEWPVDWFAIWLRGRRFRRGLSVGCGAGAFERDLIQHDLCDRIDAFDASLASVIAARERAESGGYRNRVHYFVADFNTCALPQRTYDIVFFHQSLHHVARIEALLDQVARALTSKGLVYLDEYIGPSRTEWSDKLIAAHRAIYDRLPERVKLTSELPLPIQADDPSEAIRSGEVLAKLKEQFDILAFRGYGGNLLSVVFPNLRRDELTDDVVRELIAADRSVTQSHGQPYYAVMIARAKQEITTPNALQPTLGVEASANQMKNFWDREVVEQRHIAWMAIPEVRHYLNQRVNSGGEPLWPIELLEAFLGRPTFDRGLSIGCGSGALERQLIERGFCKRIDAFDGSVGSLAIAHREASRLRMDDRIRYFAADFNEPVLPKARYDIVFFHQAAHHVAKLEKLYRALMRSLKPRGLVYFDEYVGPSRTEWAAKPELLDAHRRIFETIPDWLHAYEKVNPPIQVDDPSEAIRSSEIESELRIGFKVVGKQDYGGGILSVVLPNLRLDEIDGDTLRRLIEEDRNAPSFYTLMLATPKRGIRGLLARARYWTEPKMKRVIREIRRRFAKD